MADPTPTAEDRARARAVSPPCWYRSQDDPDATCEGVGAPDRCHECQTADAIARLLAQVRAEEREAALALVAMATDATRACLSEKLRVEEEHYYRGRVEHGEHVRDLIVKHAAIRAREGADDGK